MWRNCCLKSNIRENQMGNENIIFNDIHFQHNIDKLLSNLYERNNNFKQG
jgi:hypothetical protein